MQEEGLRCQRLGDHHDAGTLYQVTALAYGGELTWQVADFARDMLAKQSLYIGCEMAGTIVGYIAVQFLFEEATITNFAVLPEWQGRGVGQSLWRTLVAELQREFITDVFLEVRASNTRARQFYEQQQFVEIAVRERYYQQPTEAAIIYRWKGQGADGATGKHFSD